MLALRFVCASFKHTLVNFLEHPVMLRVIHAVVLCPIKFSAILMLAFRVSLIFLSEFRIELQI